jgi:hypothetical protein
LHIFGQGPGGEALMRTRPLDDLNCDSVRKLKVVCLGSNREFVCGYRYRTSTSVDEGQTGFGHDRYSEIL